MRIAYATTIRLPSERARAFHVAKVVEVFHESNHVVDIFTPFSKASADQSFEAYYGLVSPVRLHRLGKLGSVGKVLPAGISTALINRAFQKQLKKELTDRRGDFDLLYTRSPELLPILVPLKVPIILELDHIPRMRKATFMKLLRGCRLIVALTSHMRQELIDMGAVSVPVITEGDAVDLHDFEAVPSAADTRSSLGVPPKLPLIVYAGQLEAGGLSKGVTEFLGSLRSLRKRGLEFRAILAGGPDAAKRKFEASLNDDLKTHVKFLGRISHLKIPTLLTAADVLVYPAPKSSHSFFMRDVSPLTLFEYMAAGRPIVAADLPPLHDVVNDTMVTFAPAGDIDALADTIRGVLDDAEGSARKAVLARKHVEQFTWFRRMERILAAARFQLR